VSLLRVERKSVTKSYTKYLEDHIKRAQHRFGGIQGESKNEGRIRDDRTFNGRMQDKNSAAGKGFVHFDKWNSFNIDSVKQIEKRKITCYRHYAENCNFNQVAGLSQKKWQDAGWIVACVAGGILGASAFVLVAKP